MKIFCFCLLFLCLAATAQAAFGQATATATKAGVLRVGITLSDGTTDYVPSRVVGAGAYATFDLTQHLGAEAEAHIMALSTPNDFVESSYLIGPRYVLHYGRFDPYAKVVIGIGTTKVVDNDYTYAANTPGSFFVLAGGGGVDFLINRRFSVRGEFEYQSWPGFKPNGLTPTVASIGIGYRIR